MRTNLRSLVAKAYRVRQGRVRQGRARQGRASSAPSPIDDKGKISIYEWLLTRGCATLAGWGLASYMVGDTTSEFEEKVKVDNKDVLEFLEKRGKLPPDWVDSMSKS
ncbi:hypothetical protein HA466_0056730 [Hirschfeldia incana]|nr:hypothetical protein HA466_0056730 [Hirschfeldia incana]